MSAHGPIAWFVPLVAGIFGLLIGSFVNVVVHRVPRGESVIFPASRCPSCGHALRVWENVPVLSWLALRGKCSSCGAAISIRYPIVELVTGALFALAFMVYGVTPAAAVYACIAALLVAILFFDLDHLLIPDVLVVPCAACGLVLGLLRHDVVGALEGGLVAGGVFGLVYAATRGRGMGLGDVKLAAALGLALGPASGIALVAASFVVGALAAVPVLLSGSRGRRDALPFGPFLVVAAYVLAFAPGIAFAPFEAYRRWMEMRGSL